MATTPINIVLKYKAVQYDGTNSAQIDGLITNFDVISESGGVLQFDSSGTFTAHTNDWVVFAQGSCFGVFPTNDFNNFFDCNISCSDAADYTSGVVVRRVGVAPVGALQLNASTTVGVALDPAMPSTSYSASALLFAETTNIAGLQINSVTVVSDSLVNVVVQSVGVATMAGANVMVTASA